MNLARGYISSGIFHGNRTPQHLQNQIVKSYCDANGLQFILSRAEYWINGSTDCQLWAALQEGFKHIVFYSIWQLPETKTGRAKVYNYCIKNEITLHFAVERMHLETNQKTYAEFEILFQSNTMVTKEIDYKHHLKMLKMLMQSP